MAPRAGSLDCWIRPRQASSSMNDIVLSYSHLRRRARLDAHRAHEFDAPMRILSIALLLCAWAGCDDDTLAKRALDLAMTALPDDGLAADLATAAGLDLSGGAPVDLAADGPGTGDGGFTPSDGGGA